MKTMSIANVSTYTWCKKWDRVKEITHENLACNPDSSLPDADFISFFILIVCLKPLIEITRMVRSLQVYGGGAEWFPLYLASVCPTKLRGTASGKLKYFRTPPGRRSYLTGRRGTIL